MNVLEWPQNHPEGPWRASDSGWLEDRNVVHRGSFTRQMWHDRQLPSDLSNALWQNADQVLRSGKMLKDGDRSTVVQIGSSSVLDADTLFVLKRYNLRGPLHTALHLSLRTRARNCWRFGRQLTAHGIASPAPWAFLEHRFGAFRTRSFLLTEYIAGTHLVDYLSKTSGSQSNLEIVSAEFARVWSTLGALHLGHGDMKATNFIVSQDRQLWLIDLDAMQVCRNPFSFRSARRRDWKRFMKNWVESPEVALAFYNAVKRRQQDRLPTAA